MSDEFGKAVAVAGNAVVVDARYEDSDTTGVNGDVNDLKPDSGAAVC